MYKYLGVFSGNQYKTSSLTSHNLPEARCVTGSLHKRHLVDSYSSMSQPNSKHQREMSVCKGESVT